ncbi:aspartate aminotransferase family protein [Tsukamurella soli]|uniref:aspartate aminotransferase family protein n=1 Tax=Tsukamurella soli TaxID=644556 RepID=UPI0036219EB7
MTSPLDVNRFSPDDAADLPAETRELLDRRRGTLGDVTPLLYRRPVHLVRGEGLWLTDADGVRYLDMYNNVASVGHCHPRVVEAVSRQLSTLNTHTRYLHEGVIDYARQLLATLPAAFGEMVFTCTGSEANDLAVRIARHVTGHRGVIVTAGAYHGGTTVSAACSPSVDPAVPDWVRIVPAPDPFREGADESVRSFAAAVARQVDDLTASGIGTAALLVDTVFSSDGIQPGPLGLLGPAVEAVRAGGGLFIADEVQPGFGRLGEGMWGFDRHSVVPDLVTMGKPMAAGIPVAALAATTRTAEAVGRKVPYFNTFGGNPVSMAAAQAVLDVIRDEGLIENAAARGKQLLDGLAPMRESFAVVGDVRVAGLFAGVEIVGAGGAPDTATATAVVNTLRDRGVLLSTAGVHGNVLKIRPPLPIAESEMDHFLQVFGEVLTDLP